MSLGEHQEYEKSILIEDELDADPFAQLFSWLDTAINNERVQEANAMTIATVDADGWPSARVVLLRALSTEGLTFYTNYNSRKGQELAVNPRIAAVFFWPELQRQVRIEGSVSKVSARESDEYFAGRPIKSQMGATISNQSSVISSRQVIEDALQRLDQQSEITRPDHWGGYRIIPHTFEFWQGRRSRLHDRLRYRVIGGVWKIDRLAP